MSVIPVPDSCLVLLVGPSGSGKTTFAHRNFLSTEVVSSDACRALVADDENMLDANEDAFALLHAIVAARLRRGRLTVVDATNISAQAREPLIRLAREHGRPPVAVVFDLDRTVLMERGRARSERSLPAHVVSRHIAQLRRSLSTLGSEGFDQVTVLRSADEVRAATVERTTLRTGR